MDFSVSATTGGYFSKKPRAPKQFGRTNLASESVRSTIESSCLALFWGVSLGSGEQACPPPGDEELPGPDWLRRA
ncbi:hypothetical protein A2U01_0093326, partial [Trifolium medium]|nr:hypothetical protein [Trifolium medium]